MIHPKDYAHLVLEIVAKASDGKLTLDEVTESLRDFSPAHFAELDDAVNDALKDGHISVFEVFKILQALF